MTLAIEWAAKPRLEARKERILDVHKGRREVVRCLGIITMNSGLLEHDLPPEMNSAARTAVLKNMEDRRAAVAFAGRKIEDEAVSFYLTMRNGRARTVLARVTGLAQAIAISRRPRQEAGSELHAAAGPVLDYFGLPWWRWRSRQKAFRRAEVVLGVSVNGAGPTDSISDAAESAESE